MWEGISKWADDTVDITIEFGTELGAKGTIYGVDVGGVTKNYIQSDDHFEARFKSEAEITAGKQDLFEIEVSGEYDASSYKFTRTVGINGANWDGTLKTSFGGEVYAGIGGAYITVDWIKVGDALYHFIEALIGCDSQK